jgi:hypothetical protein
VSEEQVTNNREAEEQDAEDENKVEQVFARRNHRVHEDAELKKYTFERSTQRTSADKHVEHAITQRRMLPLGMV